MASLLAAAARKSLYFSVAPSSSRVAPSLCFQSPSLLLGAVRNFGYKRHKRLLKHAKGYRGKSKNCFTVAIRRVHKAWQYAYRDRRVKKREWRRLWISRCNAGARQYNVRYSRLIAHLRYCRIDLNRKVLSELAGMEPFAFKAVIDVIQAERREYLQKKEEDERAAAEEEAERTPVAA